MLLRLFKLAKNPIFLILGVFIASNVSYISAAYADLKEDTIKIGYAGPLTGALAIQGLSAYYGLEYAVNQANQNGGILGRKIEIVKEDDVCAPDQAISSATRLVGKGVKLIVGHTCSGSTKTALTVYGDKAIVISPSSTEKSLTDDGLYPYFFRTIARDDVFSKLQVDLIKKSGLKKVAILHDKSDYGKSIAELAKQAVEEESGAGLSVVLIDGITSGAVDYSGTINKLKSSGAEALIWGGYQPDASKLLIQMRNKKLTTLFLGPDSILNDNFIQLAGHASEGVMAVGPADITSNPLSVKAFEDHIARYNSDPGPFFLNGVAAANKILDAIEKTGNAEDLKTIKEHLTSDKIETPFGPLVFDKKGDPEGIECRIFVVENGVYKPYNY